MRALRLFRSISTKDRPNSARRSHDAKKRGMTVVFFSFMLVGMMGFLALSIDLGYVATVKTELKRATDAGALAGAGALVLGPDEAMERVTEYIQLNPVGGRTVLPEDVTVELGHWDDQTRTFLASEQLPSAVRVQVEHPDQPLFFARVLGQDEFDLADESIAMYQPRDIVLVLDYSASMNDDSELRNVDTMGAEFIESNLATIHSELGSPTFGSMQWDETLPSSWSNWSVRNYLGLNSVSYPYPSGSWYDYVNYVKGSSLPSQYRHHFGYMTLMNYWLQRQPKANQTPDLWKTSEQPITALKNSVTVFLSFLQQVDTDDRLGLAVYTAQDGTATLEHELTADFAAVEETSRHRQAGHYDYYTNIGAGINVGRQEIVDHGRTGAFKMIVLITDGIANRPYDTVTAKQYAMDEAQLAADEGIPIVTISLGAGADTWLMQDIADLTGGIHFNVPGGQPVADYEEDLKQVFEDIASDRPLKLVK
ncbi:MAG: VWA domain-containing protein [Pirellulales bacterium]|nr:VWA domain-containing protein [Pirellulales bacterium]